MNKGIVFSVIGICFLAFAVMFVSCDNGGGGGELDSALFGKWEHATDYDVFTFNQNGTFDWDGFTGTWSTEKNILTLVWDDGDPDESWSYSFKGSDLYIAGDGPYKKK